MRHSCLITWNEEVCFCFWLRQPSLNKMASTKLNVKTVNVFGINESQNIFINTVCRKIASAVIKSTVWQNFVKLVSLCTTSPGFRLLMHKQAKFFGFETLEKLYSPDHGSDKIKNDIAILHIWDDFVEKLYFELLMKTENKM